MQKNRPAPLGMTVAVVIVAEMTVGCWRTRRANGVATHAPQCQNGRSFAEVFQAEVAELDFYAGFGTEAFG